MQCRSLPRLPRHQLESQRCNQPRQAKTTLPEPPTCPAAPAATTTYPGTAATGNAATTSSATAAAAAQPAQQTERDCVNHPSPQPSSPSRSDSGASTCPAQPQRHSQLATPNTAPTCP